MDLFFILSFYSSTIFNAKDIILYEVSSLTSYPNIISLPFITYLINIFWFKVFNLILTTPINPRLADFFIVNVYSNHIRYVNQDIHTHLLNNTNFNSTFNLVLTNPDFQNLQLYLNYDLMVVDMNYYTSWLDFKIQTLSGFNITSNFKTFEDSKYSFDLLIIVLELLLLFIVLRSFFSYKKIKNNMYLFYDDVCAFFIKNNLSFNEFVLFFTVFFGFCFFDIFVSFAEEDLIDSFLAFCLLLFFGTFFFFFIDLDLQYFYNTSSTSNGSTISRTVFFDIINNTLCVARIFICVIRYISYDLQVEFLDLSFHFVDNNNDFLMLQLFQNTSNNFIANNLNINNTQTFMLTKTLFSFFLYVYIDIFFIIVQSLLSIFKYFIAIYLFWLIIDFFLFKSLSYSETK